VVNGQAKEVRGVYVPGILALRVLQQPQGDPGLVLRVDGVATQFRLAARNRVIGYWLTTIWLAQLFQA